MVENAEFTRIANLEDFSTISIPERSEFLYNVLEKFIINNNLFETQVVNNNPNNNKVAVIIEPRKHKFFEYVLRNIMYFCLKKNNDWNLQIVTCQETSDWLKEKFPNWNYKTIILPVNNLNQDQYNNLLLSKDFWNTINEENILIFQTDTMMFRDNIDDFLEYDFIGANFFDPNDVSATHGGNNGGFSFRHKSAMLDCLDKISNYDVVLYLKSLGRKYVKENVMEDVYFTCACEMIGKKLSTIEDRQYFSVEDARNDKCLTPVGCHRLYSKELSHTLLYILKISNILCV